MQFHTLTIILALSFLVLPGLSACSGGNQETAPDVSPSETENKIKENDIEVPQQPGVTDKATPLNTTIYNNSKDLWGWNSGDYIQLRWDRKDYTQWLVYKKSGEAENWEKAYEDVVMRNEFFDREIRDLRTIHYRIEAVNRQKQVLEAYDPLIFHMEN